MAVGFAQQFGAHYHCRSGVSQAGAAQ